MKALANAAAPLLLLLFAAAYPNQPFAAGQSTIQSLVSGKCIDLERGTTVDGPVVIQFDCHSGRSEQWSIQGSGGAGYRIVSKLSGKCVGIDRRAGADTSTPVIQSNCGSGTSEQLWSLESRGGGNVIKSIASRRCLDVPGGSRISGVKLLAWRCSGAQNQVWRITP